MNIVQCVPAVKEGDFSALASQNIPDDEESFFSSLEFGVPCRLETPIPNTVPRIREGLLQLSKRIGCDFVVYGVPDQWGGGECAAVVIRLANMTHGGRIRHSVFEAIKSAQKGEQVAFTRQGANPDVFFHILTALEEASDATGDIIAWRHSDDIRYVIAERINGALDKRSIVLKRPEARFCKFIHPKSNRDADYHYLGIGESCVISYDGTPARALNIRTIVSAYGRRNGKKFKVKKAQDRMTVTRIE